MKWRFQWLYRLMLVGLFIAAFWAVWASAQSADTNAPAVGTNQIGGVQKTLSELERKMSERDWIFHLDKVEALRTNALFGQPIWKYLSSLVYVFLAFYVSKFLDYLTGVWLKRLAVRTSSRFDDLLLETLRGPVKVIAFVIFLHIGLTVFKWPATAQAFLSKGLIVIVAFSLTYVALKIVDLMMGVWRERTAVGADKSFDEQLYPIIRKSIKLFVVIVAVLITAQNLQINITGAIASLSIGGLAIGLAAQDTLANLFGAVAVYMDKPFRIGDRIKVENIEGVVQTIGIRSTRVTNADGHHVAIPNKMMGNAIITNITRRPTIRTEMNIGITYDTPVEKVQRATAILEEVFRANPKTSDLIISFNKFLDSALNILVVHVWNGTDGKAHLADLQALNLKIKERFDAEKIEFAYPTQTVVLKQDASQMSPAKSPALT
ncbi:MAG TPA: mechanosensitive ion channel family protein [Verrucomicrobiae bacterium]|nr:mechanosensitive ion channel family protein [Verrucomicrobiae bacterium]